MNLNANKKIYIAGAGGMLGDAFYKVFKPDYEIKCTDKDVNEDWLTFLDFRNAASYKNDVLKFKPDYLFHIGAHTDLEYCETHKEDAYLTNAVSVITATDIANELNIPLLYISTAGIFDGGKELYDDWDTPNPMGHYARSKYMGERYVTEYARQFLICRAGWMMGGGSGKDKKFINKLIRQLVNGQRELYIVDDREGTPTFTFDFAANVKLLIENNCSGLYNMVCTGQTSRFEVAEELVRQLSLEHEVVLHKVSSDYYSEKYFAPRPPSECLVNKRLDDAGLNIMRDWKLALKEYLEGSFQDCMHGMLTKARLIA